MHCSFFMRFAQSADLAPDFWWILHVAVPSMPFCLVAWSACQALYQHGRKMHTVAKTGPGLVSFCLQALIGGFAVSTAPACDCMRTALLTTAERGDRWHGRIDLCRDSLLPLRLCSRNPCSQLRASIAKMARQTPHRHYLKDSAIHQTLHPVREGARPKTPQPAIPQMRLNQNGPKPLNPIQVLDFLNPETLAQLGGKKP